MEYVNPEGLQLDGRHPMELRKLHGKIGVVSRADGWICLLKMVTPKDDLKLPTDDALLTQPRTLGHCQLSLWMMRFLMSRCFVLEMLHVLDKKEREIRRRHREGISWYLI